jgi:hypothetical protein
VIATDMLWPREPARRLAAMAFWGPLLLPAILAPIVGFEITSLWTMSAWAMLPVVLLSPLPIELDRRPVLVTIAAAVLLPIVMVAAAPFIAGSIHSKGGTPAAMHSRLLADRVAHEWRRVTDKPLKMVGGDSDLAYGVAFYLPSRPQAFPDFNRLLAPWVDVTRLPRDGIAIVCPASDPTCVLPAAALNLTGPRIEADLTRSYFGKPGATGRYLIMIVPPRP